MKRVLNLLLLAGALILYPAHSANAKQSTTETTADSQKKATNQASSKDRHHHRRTNTAQRHRHHKTTSKQDPQFHSIGIGGVVTHSPLPHYRVRIQRFGGLS